MDIARVGRNYRARLEMLEATGPTKFEAQAALFDQVEAALARCRRVPTLIDTLQGVVGVVWADPNGYCYFISDNKAVAGASISARGFCSFNTFEEAERVLRRHLAQWLFDPKKPGDCAWLITHPDDRAQHLDWVRWQRAYSDGKKRGMTDQEARDYATTGPHS